MSQMGFFDADKRLSALSLKGDPLEAISGAGALGDVSRRHRGGGADAEEVEEEQGRVASRSMRW